MFYDTSDNSNQERLFKEFGAGLALYTDKQINDICSTVWDIYVKATNLKPIFNKKQIIKWIKKGVNYEY